MYLDTKLYPFTASLEANWPVIRGELDALARENYKAWPDRHLYGQPKQHKDGTGWDLFGLYVFGQRREENCRLCPETARVVAAIPGLVTAAFSRLEPGTHIKPHVGYTKEVLRCHLGVMVPGDCALRVGDETRAWQEGACMVFDDTTEHEAWNRSDKVRVVLLIDFTRDAVPTAGPARVAEAVPAAS
jgi:aspartyl/asparaginyl beta-hydroxylase (cupin superfamily)